MAKRADSHPHSVTRSLASSRKRSVWVLFDFEEEGSEEEWRPFKSDDQLENFIRRESGEPIRLPPISLTPEASEQIVRRPSLSSSSGIPTRQGQGSEEERDD